MKMLTRAGHATPVAFVGVSRNAACAACPRYPEHHVFSRVFIMAGWPPKRMKTASPGVATRHADLRVRHTEAGSLDRMWGGAVRCGGLSVRHLGFGLLDFNHWHSRRRMRE